MVEREMSEKRPARAMVLIAKDQHFGAAARPAEGPMSEFVAIANLTGASIHSSTAGMARHGAWFRLLFRRRPALGAAVHAALVSDEFDAIYTTGEDLGLPLAALLAMRRWRGKLICVFHNLTSKKRFLLRLIGGGMFYRIITVSERQRDLLLEVGCIAPDRIVNVRNWVDTDFFRPDPLIADGGYFIACGAENRDYASLVAAAKLTSRQIKIFGHGFLSEATPNTDARPSNLELGARVSYEALRREYAGATGVVIPLNPVDYAAGVTGLVEGMAMGKPIIVTRSDGISDYLREINPGIEVEPRNSDNLAEAIEKMGNDRGFYDMQGKKNREWVLSKCSLSSYAIQISSYMDS